MFPVLVVCAVVAMLAQIVHGMLAHKVYCDAALHSAVVYKVDRTVRIVAVHQGDRVGILKRTCCVARRANEQSLVRRIALPAQYDRSIS